MGRRWGIVVMAVALLCASCASSQASRAPTAAPTQRAVPTPATGDGPGGPGRSRTPRCVVRRPRTSRPPSPRSPRSWPPGWSRRGARGARSRWRTSATSRSPIATSTGEKVQGELVVHADAAEDMVTVFRALFDAGYPVRSMRLVDDFDASDDASMDADNTSAFNCRAITGGTGWSEHAYGRAIDVNPVENPYVSGSSVGPSAGPDVRRPPRQPGRHPRRRRGGPRVRRGRVALGWRLGLPGGLPALLAVGPLSAACRPAGRRPRQRRSAMSRTVSAFSGDAERAARPRRSHPPRKPEIQGCGEGSCRTSERPVLRVWVSSPGWESRMSGRCSRPSCTDRRSVGQARRPR